MLSPAHEAAAAFALAGPVQAVEPLLIGLIHASYVVSSGDAGGACRRYLLQRLNPQVLTDVPAVMGNLERVTTHLRARLVEQGLPDPRRRVLHSVPTVTGQACHRDREGHWWRAFHFIEGSHSHNRAPNPETARRAAAAFARFVAELSDLPPPRLHEPLPGFHDTPARYRCLEAVYGDFEPPRASPPIHAGAGGAGLPADRRGDREDAPTTRSPAAPGSAGRTAQSTEPPPARTLAAVPVPARRSGESAPGLPELARDRARRAAEVRPEMHFIRARAGELGLLQEAAARGELPERPVHNDTKLNNVLFDACTGEALCVVDLDTVMPGLAAHDYGDLVRSTAAAIPEDTADPSRVGLSLPLLEAVTRGWVATLRDLLTAAEAALLSRAPGLIALELAIRFLTDHLQGDRYFRVDAPGHNLARCRTQLALVVELERHERRIAASIRQALGG